MTHLIKVEGEVVVKDGTGRSIEFYEEEFTLAVGEKNKARSLIRKGLITDRLRRKIPAFKSVRTCQVVSIEVSDTPIESDPLADAMLQAIELGCVPENIDNYKRPDHKLKAIERAIAAHKKRKEPVDTCVDQGVID